MRGPRLQQDTSGDVEAQSITYFGNVAELWEPLSVIDIMFVNSQTDLRRLLINQKNELVKV